MTKILGIVNLTDDSFSDGGHIEHADQAIQYALQLIDDGAHAIDLGPASSHPDRDILPPEVEIARLEPVLDALLAEQIMVSVDSFQPEVQRFALQKGVQMLNDVHGFAHPDFYPVLADSDCQLVVMHSVHGAGETLKVVTAADVIMQKITAFFDERIAALQAAGISADRIIIDPGMGFFLSSESEASFTVLQNLDYLDLQYGFPMMVCVSRKSFVQRTVNRLPQESGAATLAAELFLVNEGVDWIRTHDVRALADAIKINDRVYGDLLMNDDVEVIGGEVYVEH